MTALVWSLFLIGVWVNATHYSNPVRPGDFSVRVVEWNAGRPKHSHWAAREFIMKRNPDIVAVIESGEIGKSAAEGRLALEPEWSAAYIGGGMTVLAKGLISNVEYNGSASGVRIGFCQATITDSRLSLMVVDVKSNPFQSRKKALQRIAERASMENPDVILGDFNTPPGSVWFKMLRTDYCNAFEEAGSGMWLTWPSILPVLAIDHIWSRKTLNLSAARILRTFASDHSAVMAEFQRESESQI